MDLLKFQATGSVVEKFENSRQYINVKVLTRLKGFLSLLAKAT